MKNETIKMTVNYSFIVNALRNCGYTNYSAIADIIDNSIEPNVRGTYVNIDTETIGKGSELKIDKIKIIDDGIGMDKETLIEAMSLGSNTGKNPDLNLGMYGAGMKTAAFSIGQKLEVLTKTDIGSLEYACISLTEFINSESDDINVDFKTFDNNSNEYKYFINLISLKNKKANSGTVVIISNLDKLVEKNNLNFLETLKYHISDNFNKFIDQDSKNFTFYVNGNKVIYTDFIGENATEMKSGIFLVGGNEIKYKAWKIADISGTKHNNIKSAHCISSDETRYFVPKSQRWQGFYIYRNNRLVGHGLTLGVWARHPTRNGFRCELFINGNCDSLFGSTFTKMISDKDIESIDQSLRDQLINTIKSLSDEVARDEEKNSSLNPESIKQHIEIANTATNDLNKNSMLSINRRGINQKRNEDIEHKKIGPQKNPCKIRIRNEKWIDGFEERPLGKNEARFMPEHRNNKLFIIINTDHQYYKEFFSKLPAELMSKVCKILACDEIAKQNVNYYGSDDIRTYIDTYNERMSDEINKVLLF